MLNPQPDDETLAAIYGDTYFIGSNEDALREQGNVLKRGTARLQLAEISTYIGARVAADIHPQMLEVGCGLGNFLIEARAAGFDVRGIDVSADAVATANAALGEDRARAGMLEEAGFEPEQFGIIVLADVIEHVRNPKSFMQHVRALLKPGGIIFVAVPSLDSLSARLMGRYWVEFKREHLFYFNRQTIRQLLEDCGFQDIAISPGRKVLSLGYIIGHFKQFPVPLFTPVLKVLERLLPRALLSRPMQIVASGLNAIARVPTKNESN
jgi:SAM-dependent methyltransferase